MHPLSFVQFWALNVLVVLAVAQGPGFSGTIFYGIQTDDGMGGEPLSIPNSPTVHPASRSVGGGTGCVVLSDLCQGADCWSKEQILAHSGRLCPTSSGFIFLREAGMMMRVAGKRQNGFKEDGRLLMPGSALADCVALAVARDTRQGAFSAAERLNYFPATSCVTLTLFFVGETLLASDGQDQAGRVERLPAMAIFGPHRGPVVTLNPGPVNALTVAIFADAFHMLTGAEISCLVDLHMNAQDVLPPAIFEVCLKALATGTAALAFDEFEAGLAPIWQSVRRRHAILPRRAVDWTVRLIGSAATHGAGRSLRQIERRVRDWTGQTQRELMTLRRAEQTLLSVLDRMGEEHEDWADMADRQGYADQSHMIRELRRITGLPPEQLRRRMKNDKAFWLYRLLGGLA